MDHLIWKEALLTHDLKNEDIEYAVPYLINIYKSDYRALVHLLKSNYVGLFSIKYNKHIDNLIINRGFSKTDSSFFDFWPELEDSRLSPTEKSILKSYEDIHLIALSNCLNFTVVSHLSDMKLFGPESLYNFCLDNLTLEKNIDLPGTIIKLKINGEVGSSIKIIHHKYIHIMDLLENIKSGKNLEYKNTFHKELIMYN